tara:strand:- start:7324 stop:9945 length:2622 start_codon:yes stop_codon:yes gene_type:complete
MSDYKKLFEGFKNYIKEEEIKEVTEEELGDIEDILLTLTPEDLPFGDIFGDKMRLIKPLPTQDENMDYLKNILNRSGYEPDFGTGRATYYTLTMRSPGDDRSSITTILTPDQRESVFTRKPGETEEEYNERTSRFQKKEVKIGKLLQKGSRLFDIAKKSYNEFENITLSPRDFGIDADWNPDDADDIAKVKKYREAASKAEVEAEKKMASLQDVFQDYTSRPTGDVNPFQKLASWWNKKSTYYRENPDAAASGESTGEYSIIYTRQPIDVLRMSDFDNIESCHSPTSRGGGGTYYKCAVAEAHGEGAVAYVVRNEDLLNLLYADVETQEKAKDLQGLLDFYQSEDKEFFADPERGEGDIKPVSRLRLKQYRSPVAEVGLAVPEERVYGRKFPSFKKAVIQWAKDTQAKEIEKIEATKNSENPEENLFDDDALDLRKWERYGGTYQDTPDSTLFYNLLGYTTVGSARIDSSTEDNLSLNSSVADQWEQEVNAIQERYNNHMGSIQVEASVEDDGAGEVYIGVHAEFKLRIPESEFLYSAFNDETRNAILEIPSTLIDYGFNWLTDSIQYTVDDGNVVMTIPVDIEEIDHHGAGYAYAPENFEEICQRLDQKDDMADAVEENAKSVLKRYGVLHGGELIKLARVLDEESWYDWDYEVDDDWDPTHIELNTSVYVNFNELIAQIPVKFSTGLKAPTQDFFAEYDGSLIATIETWEREDGGRTYRVRSEEFEDQTGVEVGSKEEALRYIQWEIARLILNAGPYKQGPLIRASRDYAVAVRMLMRDAAGGKEGEFSYPTSRMMVSRPDADDEFQMRFIMELDDDDPDEVVENAHQIILETDDEETQRDIFLRAFAKAAKLPGASVNETRKYFNKFNIF